jgi:hypothetical protein
VARHHAIAATSTAIRALLENAAPASEWSGASFELYQADDLQSPFQGTQPRVSIYLYRLLLSSVRRDRGPRIGPDGARYRPSIPLDLHYLVTAWGADARTSQQLMGWVIRVLDDTPILPAGLLNAYQAGLDVFATDESVELVWQALSITDLNDIWQVSQVNQSPSACYVARMVALDSDVALGDGAPVRVRQLHYAKGAS